MIDVVITGMGVCCALGTSLPEFTQNLQAGTNGIIPISLFDPAAYRFQRAGEIKDLHFDNGLDRASNLALYAAESAVQDSGLDLNTHPTLPKRTAVVLGTNSGGVTTQESISRRWQHEQTALSTTQLDEVPFHVMAKHIANRYGLQGPAITVTIACASGGGAIAQGANLIKYGLADVVLAGGSDTISDFTFSGFSALRAMTTDEIRPFDRHRKGLAVGEGAAIVILESLSHAQQRRAKIDAKIAGYGIYNDAYHSTAPDPKGKGMAKSIQRAFKMANLSPQDIQYINAHGTATQHNDKMESQAFHHVFGKHIKKLPVSSTKSMIGHTLGAAGAIEMVAAILAMKHHFIPPTINSLEPDPALDLDIVPNQARTAHLERVLSCNAGFGGHNAAIILESL